MDGTVLDTSGDLTDAMNHVMEEAGHRHDYTVRDGCEFFGSGVGVAVRRALALECGAPRESLVAIGTPEEVLPQAAMRFIPDEENRLQEAFRSYYGAHCDIKTGPYPGIKEAIEKLRQAGVITALVSNKPDEAVKTLADDFFKGLFDLAVGEKKGMRRKPAPDMTLAVLRALAVDRHDAVYLGDSEIDLQTAANSGMDCISVSWGFRSVEFLKAHGAKVIASDPCELFSLVYGS